ncbi:MAG: thioredoxin family protein [Fimbriimonadaceae bacterium]
MTRWLLFGLAVVAIVGAMTRRSSAWENQDLQATLTAAKTKPILAVFGTSWCHYCKQLDEETLSDSDVKAALQNWEVVKVDAESTEGRKMAEKYGVSGFPTLVFLKPNGDVVQAASGFVPKEVFLPALGKIYTKAKH